MNSFERKFASSLGMNQAITFAYARHALTSILSASGLNAGDGVVLSPLTCKVVPLALLSLKLRPIYTDISADTLNIDPEQVESAITTGNARAVLFQHTYGNMGGIEAIARIVAQKNVLLFEDCAQCLPYAEDNRLPGSWGQAAVFSNNLRKPLPAGSGGAAVTNDSGLAKKVRELRDRFPHRSRSAELMLRAEILLHKRLLRPALYWPLFELSRKFRTTYRVESREREIAREMTDKAMQVSDYQVREGSCWLRKVEAHAVHRRLCSVEYAKAMDSVEGLQLPCMGSQQPLYYFPVLVKGKDELLQKARRRQIELIAWPIRTPIYPIESERDLPAYGYEPGVCPVAENVAATLIGLPTHSKITAGHRRRIVKLLINHNN